MNILVGSAMAALPNILHILVDDMGCANKIIVLSAAHTNSRVLGRWAEVGYHREPNDTDARTPNMDALVRNGLELDRHYAYKVHSKCWRARCLTPSVVQICSPTRCALQTGRNPIHVNVQNVDPNAHNKDDPEGGYQGEVLPERPPPLPVRDSLTPAETGIPMNMYVGLAEARGSVRLYACAPSLVVGPASQRN